MKTTLAVIVILMTMFLTGLAQAQTIKATDYYIYSVSTSMWSMNGQDTQIIVSITLPSSKDPKWTIVWNDNPGQSPNYVLVGTTPIEVFYQSKK